MGVFPVGRPQIVRAAEIYHCRQHHVASATVLPREQTQAERVPFFAPFLCLVVAGVCVWPAWVEKDDIEEECHSLIRWRTNFVWPTT